MKLKNRKRKLSVNDSHQLYFAVAFDVDRDIEIDIIGEENSVFSAISNFCTINDISKTDQPDLKVTIRKYGSLLFDLEHEYFPFRDINIHFGQAENEKALDNVSAHYKNMLPDNNVLLQYIIEQAAYTYKHSESPADDIFELIDNFTAPFRSEKVDSLIDKFRFYRKDYYKIYRSVFTEAEEYGLSAENTRYWSTSSGDIGFIAVNYNLYTIFKAYINDCGKNHKFLKRCKLCNRMMLGNIHNIGELCSEECRRKSRDSNTQRFKEKLDSNEQEAAYHSLYRKMTYQKNKLVSAGVSEADMKPFINGFKALQAEMAERRKNGTAENDNAFNCWLKEQEEKLMKIINDIPNNQKEGSS